MEKHTRFYGRVARIGVPTGDQRQVNELRHRSMPMPITWAREGEMADIGGVIDGFGMVGSDAFIVGFLLPEATEFCREKQRYLEADMDDVLVEEHETLLVFARARLSGAQLGDNPCWSGLEIRLDGEG